MDAEQVILTCLLPKTGQDILYRAGDDGDIQAGWWKGRIIANNKTRFIAKTIGGDDVVIDLATGLMWAGDNNEAGCNSGGLLSWNAAIDYANALTFAGFSDWRIPNIKELISIMNFGIVPPHIEEPPFVNTVSGAYWNSTTYLADTDKAGTIDFDSTLVTSTAKINSRLLRCVRGGL